MSFSRDSKIDILKSGTIESDCCVLAFLSGLFHGCGEISKANGKYIASFVTDVPELYDYLNEVVHKLYGEWLEIEIEDDYVINKTTYYRIKMSEENSERVLNDIGILELTPTGYEIIWGIDNRIVAEECCKKAFIKGAYLGASTSSIRLAGEEEWKKTTSGYHLEFTSHSHQFLSDLAGLLAEFGIISKLVERKSLYVLYIKEAEVIKDLLALVGANNSVLALSNEMITRERRNKVNREVNCINANINKTIDASLRQVEAINTIAETIGLDALNEDLQEVAMLRLANPEESLGDLLELSTIKLTRSGLNHRLKKLEKIAKTLKE